jgi:hypothetical protein
MSRRYSPTPDRLRTSEKRIYNTVPADQWIDKTFYILPAIYNDICLSIGDQVHGEFNIYTKDDLIDKFTKFRSYDRPIVQEVILPSDSIVTRISQIDDGDADPYTPGCRCTSSIVLMTNHIKVLSEHYPVYSLKTIFPLDYFKLLSYQDLQSISYDGTNPDIQQLIKDRQLSMSVIDLFMEQYFNETGNEKDMIIVKDSYIIFTLWYRNNGKTSDQRPTLSEYKTHIDSKIGKSFPKSGQRFNSWLEWEMHLPDDL